MQRPREIQTALCAPDERCVSPLLIGFFSLPVALLAFGVITLEPAIIVVGLTTGAGCLTTGRTLLRTSLATRADDWFAGTEIVLGSADRRRRRIRRVERRWRYARWIVPAIDIPFVYAVVQAVLRPTPVQPDQQTAAFVVGLVFTLAALLGTGWLIGAWLELRDHRRPKKLFADPLVRARDIAELLEREGTLWLAWGLVALASLLVATLSIVG
jgi:hypothetical protein